MPTEEQPNSSPLHDSATDTQAEVEAQPQTAKKAEVEATLVSWEAPSRPFKPRSRDFYVKIISIAVLFGVVLFLIDGIMPVLLIVALLFLFHVLNTVQPENIQYKVTNKGIYIADKGMSWEKFGRFWFMNRAGSEMLVIEAANIAGRLEIIVPEDKRAEVEKTLTEYLVHEEIPPSFFDKAADWASNRLPLE